LQHLTLTASVKEVIDEEINKIRWQHWTSDNRNIWKSDFSTSGFQMVKSHKNELTILILDLYSNSLLV
jgi:hypothetical protein